MKHLLRRDLADVIHYDVLIRGRHYAGEWTPLCEPNADWLICVGDRANVGEVPTCLWCLANSRKR